MQALSLLGDLTLSLDATILSTAGLLLLALMAAALTEMAMSLGLQPLGAGLPAAAQQAAAQQGAAPLAAALLAAMPLLLTPWPTTLPPTMPLGVATWLAVLLSLTSTMAQPWAVLALVRTAVSAAAMTATCATGGICK